MQTFRDDRQSQRTRLFCSCLLKRSENGNIGLYKLVSATLKLYILRHKFTNMKALQQVMQSIQLNEAGFKKTCYNYQFIIKHIYMH